MTNQGKWKSFSSKLPDVLLRIEFTPVTERARQSWSITDVYKRSANGISASLLRRRDNKTTFFVAVDLFFPEH